VGVDDDKDGWAVSARQCGAPRRKNWPSGGPSTKSTNEICTRWQTAPQRVPVVADGTHRDHLGHASHDAHGAQGRQGPARPTQMGRFGSLLRSNRTTVFRSQKP
jgi:hypothetical protein